MLPNAIVDASDAAPDLQWKLWIYTNYDCNLRCSYCVAKSSPNALRRAIGLANVRRLVDEAIALGFTDVFFTGGEPFILNEIYDMLAYASARIKTTVLTNAMIVRGPRLEKLVAIANDNLIVQVSLDGGRAEDHDAYRGVGAWAKTVEGIQLLQARGFRVRLSTTETPANAAHLDGGADVVIGPCDDGGYYLIGLKRPQPRLLRDVEMSTPHVVRDTLALAEQLGLRVALLPAWYDVDTVAELARLRTEVAALPAAVARHTRTFLAANGYE
jgi:pyruvate-formate lyase-activating enzyme